MSNLQIVFKTISKYGNYILIPLPCGLPLSMIHNNQNSELE